MNSSSLVRFGVNYVPSRNWWYSWVDWDAASISDDLQAIAALGMDHIRIHCLWPIFQPNPNRISQAAMDRLVELLDLADAAKLDVEVTVLDGWLSGFIFAPAWQGGRNMFTDEWMVVAEELLFEQIGKRVAGHRRFMGFDLGNELGVIMHPHNPVTPDEADRWQARMFQACERAAPGKFHVNGVDHQHWFREFGFSRPALASVGAATSVHTWIEFTGFSATYGATSVAAEHLTEYCIQLALAYHIDPRRPIWLQEFGVSSKWMPLDRIPHFSEQSFRNAMSCENLWGCTWWCSHDLNPDLRGFDPLEYDLGLLDASNRVKPNGDHIARLIQQWKTSPPQPARRTQALIVPESAFGAQRDESLQFSRKWVDLIREGVGPAIVPEGRANDPDYLQTRGITQVIG
jgi:endo-1,4-beta-mannosidase